MPRGPKGEKRPADVIGNAVRIMQIATGEAEENLSQPAMKGKRKGGLSRAKSLTPAERSEIASVAAQARWKKAD